MFENLSDSLALAHESFVAAGLESDCEQILADEVLPKCPNVRITEDCHAEDRLFDYMSFVFCFFAEDRDWAQGLAIFCLVLWVFFAFFVMGVIADKFFSGALAALAKLLGLSENIAGVILLALGNGAPDIFGAIVDPDRDSEIFVTEQLGGAVFMICLVGGLVIISNPFVMKGRNLIRDVFFLMLTVGMVEYSISDGYYQLEEAIGTLLLYVFYIATVFFMDWLARKIQKAKRHRAMAIVGVLDVMSHRSDAYSAMRPDIQARIDQINRNLEIQIERAVLIEDLDRQPCSFLKDLKELFSYLDEWKEANLLTRAYFALHVPTFAVLLFIIPIYDLTAPQHGWNKALNIINLFVLPQVFCIEILETLLGIPVPLLVLALSGVFGVLVFFTSSASKPPKYHWVFGVVNFIGSVIVIFGFSAEIIAVLNTLSVILSLTGSFIGVTVLSFGKGVGDAVANVSLAKQGYTEMAFSACFGGAIFNISLTVGFAFLSKAFRLEDNLPYARMGTLGPNCTFFIHVVPILLLFGLAQNGFQARRSMGCFLVTTYLVFLFLSTLGEFEVIHPMGSDHQSEEKDYE